MPASNATKPRREMILDIEDPKGNQIEVPVQSPGATIRVAVGAPRRRSAVWRIWGNTNKSDVYVAARVLAGVNKISLHESGDWRHQWVTATEAARHTGSPDRRIDQWAAPDTGPVGWIKGVTIWVSGLDIVCHPRDTQTRSGVIWLPDPGPSGGVGIYIMVVRPNGGELSSVGGLPVAAFALADGRAAVIVASYTTALPEERLAWLATQRTAVRNTADADTLASIEAPRAMLFGVAADGSRVLYDIALKP